jgi:hypothetical protein
MASPTSRLSANERVRTRDLIDLAGCDTGRALDAGTWDGHLALRLADRYDAVVAMDLRPPALSHPRVRVIKGDITAMPFEDDAFDLVMCTEVLEHVPPDRLERACSELARVTRRHLVVGVPYRQDLRLGRTACADCGVLNPPWGHVNSFDRDRLLSLFPGLRPRQMSLMGRVDGRTNALAVAVTDLAGNPYGTYSQEQPCLACDRPLVRPPSPRGVRRALSALGLALRYGSVIRRGRFAPGWLHMRFENVPPVNAGPAGSGQ